MPPPNAKKKEKGVKFPARQFFTSPDGDAEKNNPQVIPIPMPCTFCQSAGADFQCGVCGSLYCGVRCQLSDWQNHRIHSCVPRLVKATPVFYSPELWANQLPPKPTMPQQQDRAPTPQQPAPAPMTQQHAYLSMLPPPQPVVPMVLQHTYVPMPQQQPGVPMPHQQAYVSIPQRQAKQNTVPPMPQQQAIVPTPQQKAHVPMAQQQAYVPLPQQQAVVKMPKKKAVAPVPQQQADSRTPHRHFLTLPAECDLSIPPPTGLIPGPAMNGQQSHPPPAQPKLPNKKLNEQPLGTKPDVLSAVCSDVEERPNSNRPKKLTLYEALVARGLIPAGTPMPAALKRGVLFEKLKSLGLLAGTSPSDEQQQPPEAKQKGKQQRTLKAGPFPQPGSKVRISFVGDGQLYIYNAGLESNGVPSQYLQFMKRSLDAARRVTECLQAAPQLGDILFAPFDGECFRAVVKSLDDTNVTVFFPDFGNTQTVGWGQCKAIPDANFMYADCLAHAVLVDKATKFTAGMGDFLQSLVEVEEFELVKVHTMPNTPYKVVDLHHPHELYLLSARLQALPSSASSVEQKTPTVPDQTVDLDPAPDGTSLEVTEAVPYTPLYSGDLLPAVFPPKKGAMLSIADLPIDKKGSEISVLSEAAIDALSELMEQCHQCGESDPQPYQPKQTGEVCLVKYDGVWCRGTARMDLDHFMLLDLGIEYTLKNELDVRRYPPELSRQLYVQACIVDNPSVLKFVMADDEEPTVGLEGKILEADVYQPAGAKAVHLKILSFLN